MREHEMLGAEPTKTLTGAHHGHHTDDGPRLESDREELYMQAGGGDGSSDNRPTNPMLANAAAAGAAC